MTRTMWLAATIVVGLAAAALFSQPAVRAQETGTVKLFNGKDFTGWKMFLDPKAKAKPEDVWTIEDGVIHCAGKPNGYLITDKDYGDYVLRVEWRWGKNVTKAPNSGVFVHVTGPDQIWPKGIEAQLASGRAGDFWLVGNYKLTVDPARRDPKVERHFFRIQKDPVEKPVGEWNQYEITCKGDTIKLAVNGQVVNEGTAAESTKGKILLQSEGSEIFFRNIELKPLK